MHTNEDQLPTTPHSLFSHNHHRKVDILFFLHLLSRLRKNDQNNTNPRWNFFVKSKSRLEPINKKNRMQSVWIQYTYTIHTETVYRVVILRLTEEGNRVASACRYEEHSAYWPRNRCFTATTAAAMDFAFICHFLLLECFLVSLNL